MPALGDGLPPADVAAVALYFVVLLVIAFWGTIRAKCRGRG